MATLFIVGTPIGNLEDVTLRALRVLEEADIILCEDTRVTKRLLDKYAIADKPQAAEQRSLRGRQLITYNEQESGVTAGKIIGWLGEGKNVAMVSDAGTPGISDPGSLLVQKVREALPEVKIESVPGASALTAALSIAGVPVHDFVFLGFLPHKKGRETLFKEIAASRRTMIFYEAPHRILKTLESLQKFAPEKRITIARELTKMFEEVLSGPSSELIEKLRAAPEKQKGEFVVIVA